MAQRANKGLTLISHNERCNMSEQLAGKVAIISGAAGGQGAAEAKLFIDRGARVVLTDFNVELGQQTAAALGENARFVAHDVSQAADWERVVATAVAEFGRIDILVNNAGILAMDSLENTTEATLNRLMSVNVTGAFLGMKAVLPHLKAAGGGSIVNISSLAGITGQVGATAYSASKWAVRGMTKSAALELGVFGIRVNSVHPGTIATPMTAAFMTSGAEAPEHFPFAALDRVGTAEDVAPMVAFLASDDASYITGSEFLVDGGSAAGDSAVLNGILMQG